MWVKSIAECSKGSILHYLTFIKLPFVIEIFVLSIFEWLFYTGFTVLIFGGYFYLELLRLKTKIPKYEAAKYNFKFSYTISEKWKHTLSILVSVSSKTRFNGRVSFNVEKPTSYIRVLLKEQICFPKVAPMKIKNNFKN